MTNLPLYRFTVAAAKDSGVIWLASKKCESRFHGCLINRLFGCLTKCKRTLLVFTYLQKSIQMYFVAFWKMRSNDLKSHCCYCL